MIDDFITRNWMETIMNFYNIFLGWFSALELSAQILTILLIILGVIGIGYIVYGSFFLVYKIVKATVILTVIIIYLSLTGIILFILLIVDNEKIGQQWAQTSHNIQKFISKAYHSKGKLTARSLVTSKPDVSAAQNPPVFIFKEKSMNNTPQSQIKQHIKQESKSTSIKYQIPEKRYENSREGKPKTEKYYCPNCGVEFTNKMMNILGEKPGVYCENCGEHFFKREINLKIAA
ncbi:MAG: hypothetical protein ACTSWY_14525 [Promethearchaeota archaeon]